ncbi:hypothetical protein [Bythopirellula polymerisocia]|uniref:Uncharacterized protein n=1 Tax=Bythopirellula polymerisocia TaxID=2528003 RepID=A0A5C6CA03_9BACT|nr:hypothetical protein [Bythopirellula polymerisocia]TWU20767.1 hypothetical protein Pla144_48180 [Bythopirellula polymerisocia]
MADTIANIVVFGAVTLTLTIGAWKWRHKPWGALVAFCLGPFWGLAIAGVIIFLVGGSRLSDGYAQGAVLLLGGIYGGFSLALFFASLQFVIRKNYEIRRDSELCKKDKVSDTWVIDQLVEIYPDDDLSKSDDASDISPDATNDRHL